MLEKAHGLCEIAMGSLELYDGQRFRAVAVRGLSDAFADMLRKGYPASENPATGPLIDGGRLTHIHDLAETDYAITRSGAELDAGRTLLCVPLRREGTLLGMIASGRKEVRPFSDKEIALLENFAAQAVIAMENARLLGELREALEEQIATAEVLQVINASPGRLEPVFDAIITKAVRLCQAEFGGFLTFDGKAFRISIETSSDRKTRTPTTRAWNRIGAIAGRRGLCPHRGCCRRRGLPSPCSIACDACRRIWRAYGAFRRLAQG
jgi:transcriptional regulator with GAF, ATPase, and Fis domain